MNCKPGDLAVMVRSKANNEGRIVEIVSPLGHEPFFDGARWGIGAGFCWLVRSASGPVRSVRRGLHLEFPCPDAWLRPIRDNDGEDESLTWAPRKEGVPA